MITLDFKGDKLTPELARTIVSDIQIEAGLDDTDGCHVVMSLPLVAAWMNLRPQDEAVTVEGQKRNFAGMPMEWTPSAPAGEIRIYRRADEIIRVIGMALPNGYSA